MPHSPDIAGQMSKLIKKIAQALNTEISDCAEIKSYNKLNIYDHHFTYELVLRLPMEPNELAQHRESKKRKAALAAERMKRIAQ